MPDALMPNALLPSALLPDCPAALHRASRNDLNAAASGAAPAIARYGIRLLTTPYIRMTAATP